MYKFEKKNLVLYDRACPIGNHMHHWFVTAGENAIILMHDQYRTTVTAALEIVDRLQKEGYEFVTVNEPYFDHYMVKDFFWL